MAEWKLFDGQVPEPSGVLAAAGWRRLEQQPGFGQRAQLVTGMVLDIAGAYQSVSDLGCGDGSLLARLRAAGISVPMWGYDLGPGDLAYGRGRGLDLRSGDITRDELEYGELVTASEVIEHLADPRRFLEGIPGRLLIVSSPSLETDDWHYDMHAWAWDEDGYRDLVTGAGWEVAAHRVCDGGPNTFSGVTRRQAFQAIGAIRR